MSAATVEALHRVGAALGAQEGTGPDDDRWLRRYREESHAEGRAEGRSETRYESAVAVLQARGIATSKNLSCRLAELGAISVAATVRTALQCASEREFLEICASEVRKKRHGGE